MYYGIVQVENISGVIHLALPKNSFEANDVIFILVHSFSHSFSCAFCTITAQILARSLANFNLSSTSGQHMNL